MRDSVRGYDLAVGDDCGDDEPWDGEWSEPAYPDTDVYCPKCKDVLSWVRTGLGGYEMCNHCGYTDGPIVLPEPPTRKEGE